MAFDNMEVTGEHKLHQQECCRQKPDCNGFRRVHGREKFGIPSVEKSLLRNNAAKRNLKNEEMG